MLSATVMPTNRMKHENPVQTKISANITKNLRLPTTHTVMLHLPLPHNYHLGRTIPPPPPHSPGHRQLSNGIGGAAVPQAESGYIYTDFCKYTDGHTRTSQSLGRLARQFADRSRFERDTVVKAKRWMTKSIVWFSKNGAVCLFLCHSIYVSQAA